MRLYNVLRTLLAVLFLAGLSTMALAEISPQPRPACDPTKMSCTPNALPKPCAPQNCLADSAAQAKFEQENNCTFPASACGDFNADTQCCGKDPRTGKAKVVDKVMTTKDVIAIGADSFTWANYLITCPDKKQNIAPPNALWQQCEKGEFHSPDDKYKIEEVRKTGIARDYCIDGCSTPPAAVAGALAIGIFLVPDRNNPTGYSAASSFKQACVNHDVCYQTCKDDQKICDTKLKNDSKEACQTIPSGHWTFSLVIGKPVNTREACVNAADEMFKFLSDLKFGLPAFNLRRQQYCQCC
ncbi:MAG: hypothetical protein Q8N48_01425 [Thiobacillus sp.]|nr:hypothetical protein [Thiobacillus sp.]MDP2977471.1 hypothetical protein [Thiobacillus sp.]